MMTNSNVDKKKKKKAADNEHRKKDTSTWDHTADPELRPESHTYISAPRGVLILIYSRVMPSLITPRTIGH